jgi:hypothetical protein
MHLRADLLHTGPAVSLAAFAPSCPHGASTPVDLAPSGLASTRSGICTPPICRHRRGPRVSCASALTPPLPAACAIPPTLTRVCQDIPADAAHGADVQHHATIMTVSAAGRRTRVDARARAEDSARSPHLPCRAQRAEFHDLLQSCHAQARRRSRSHSSGRYVTITPRLQTLSPR